MALPAKAEKYVFNIYGPHISNSPNPNQYTSLIVAFSPYPSIKSIICYIDFRAKSFPYKVFDIKSFYCGTLDWKGPP